MRKLKAIGVFLISDSLYDLSLGKYGLVLLSFTPVFKQKVYGIRGGASAAASCMWK